MFRGFFCLLFVSVSFSMTSSASSVSSSIGLRISSFSNFFSSCFLSFFSCLSCSLRSFHSEMDGWKYASIPDILVLLSFLLPSSFLNEEKYEEKNSCFHVLLSPNSLNHWNMLLLNGILVSQSRSNINLRIGCVSVQVYKLNIGLQPILNLLLFNHFLYSLSLFPFYWHRMFRNY